MFGRLFFKIKRKIKLWRYINDIYSSFSDNDIAVTGIWIKHTDGLFLAVRKHVKVLVN